MEEYKGKLIHCNGIIPCQEPAEEVGRYIEENGIDEESFKNRFFKDYNLGYILDSAKARGIHFHIATHSIATKKCEEKAAITGLPLERIIKGVYLDDIKTGKTYALAIPGTRHSTDIRLKLGEHLKIDPYEVINDNRIRRTNENKLPLGIKNGTVHPFLNKETFESGKVECIFFDYEFTDRRRIENGLDDFSITIHPSTGYDNERTSIQINCWYAFIILNEEFGDDKVKRINLV